MLRTGMIVAERYEILSNIGAGGMADVYKAKDHKLNRFVAVKVLKPEFREDKKFIRKFQTEAQAAAGLTHPNIVNVFDVGDDEGLYYIVMELIEGITLKEYIVKKGKLSVKEATSIAIQVSMGLEAAHNHGIVHRDVKPQNIIISTDGKVKVTDFGIARAASSNTISSNVMGSVHYSSPEQVRGGYSDEKSDIYSLGITIYEMVTGKVPFDGDTTVAIAIKHLQEEMIPPSAYAPDLPFSLEQIIYKCTQKSVDRRYARMEEVIADLKHSLIDPQGDFVKLAKVNTEAKTVVISDKELGEIKQTSKQNLRDEVQELEKELRAENHPAEETQEEQPALKPRKEKKKKKRRSVNRGVSILLLIFGAAVLLAAIFFIGKAAGLITVGDEGGPATQKETPTPEAPADDGLVEVPDLVGRTEAEASSLTSGLNLGTQLMGEEASDQEVGRISSQSPSAGERVAANSTIQYYISTGSSVVKVPELGGRTGIEAEAELKSAGFNVTVQKEYSALDDDGYAIVEPGYVYYTTPEGGTETAPGSDVTLVISRGREYPEGAEVPNVVGMSKNEAITVLGKWTDVQIQEEMNSEVPFDEIIAQSVAGGTVVNPDEPIVLTVSTGDRDPSQAAAGGEQAESAPENTPVPEGVWKCTQSLNVPEGYNGGLIRLRLEQDVNGTKKETVVVEGQTLEFPYQLDLTGEPGLTTGTLYLYEQIGDAYIEVGHYPLTFVKQEQA